MSLLERNLAALRQNQKLLADAIAAATDISPFVERSPDGGSTVRLGGNAGPWVQSRRAPKQESERLFRDLKLKTLQPCIVVGCGMGYAIESVLAKYPESKVVVLEYNMPLLRLMFSTIDFSKSLAARRLVIAVELKGQPLKDVLEFYADEIALFDFESLFHGYTGTIKEYAEMFADLAQWVRMKSLSLRTMMHGNKQSIMNLLDNVPHYLSTPGIEEFRDVLKDVPGVLVGAGPSLERNMSVLKDFDGKVYIHAVSSALKRV
ncbi:MAG: DUF115 domain-containing protein, partial [Planctomycetes bacterium]|nr:DUF115 domain-containing protein [Planctomycetota bacterium]